MMKVPEDCRAQRVISLHPRRVHALTPRAGRFPHPQTTRICRGVMEKAVFQREEVVPWGRTEAWVQGSPSQQPKAGSFIHGIPSERQQLSRFLTAHHP